MLRGVGARWCPSRLWRTAGIAVLAAVMASVFVWSHMMRPSPQALASIPAWVEMVGDVPPDSDNAAVLYHRAFVLTGVPDRHWDDVSVQLHTGVLPDAEMAAEADALVAKHEEALALVREAGKLPSCVYPLVPHECVTHLPPHVGAQSTVVTLEIDRAFGFARSGRAGDAFLALADALDCARNGFHGLPAVATFCDEAHTIEWTCLAARIILNECAVADADTRPFVAALRRIRPHADLMQALRAEASWGVASFDAALGGAESIPHLETVADWPDVNSACLTYSRTVFIEEMAAVMENALRPYRAVAFAEDMDCVRLPRRARLAFGRLPSQRVLLVARDEALCWQRMCLIAAGIATSGEAPETLLEADAISEELSREDPFSGRPFRYERTDGGFRLYSIGSDLDDDGGRQQHRQVGVARYDGDLVWSTG